MLLDKSKSNPIQLLRPELATDYVVSLDDMLSCRDLRQARQLCWLTDHHSTLISLTLVAPGPVKDSILTRKIFNLACLALNKLFIKENWQPLAVEIFDLPTGAEALIALDQPAEHLKHKMVELEQHYAVGRLWDIDVINQDGAILSRIDSGLAQRSCLVCHQDAKICGRNRSHSFAELTAAMAKLAESGLDSVHE